MTVDSSNKTKKFSYFNFKIKNRHTIENYNRIKIQEVFRENTSARSCFSLSQVLHYILVLHLIVVFSAFFSISFFHQRKQENGSDKTKRFFSAEEDFDCVLHLLHFFFQERYNTRKDFFNFRRSHRKQQQQERRAKNSDKTSMMRSAYIIRRHSSEKNREQ